MIGVLVGRDDQVEAPDSQRCQLADHEVGVRTAIDQDRGSRRGAHQCCIALAHVEERDREGGGSSGPDGARPDEQRQDQQHNRNGPAMKTRPGSDPPRQTAQDEESHQQLRELAACRGDRGEG